MRGAAGRSLLIATVMTVILQARFESVRWWQSPGLVAALHLTAAQSSALNDGYEKTLPELRRMSEQITELTDEVVRLNEVGAPDVELMPATERLARAISERRGRSIAFSATIDLVLDRGQRQILADLIARKLIQTQ